MAEVPQPAPQNISDDERVTYFAATHTRGKFQAFGIRSKDREKHMYVIGKTGMGKSTMLENMAIQDIQNGEGMCFIDPHGSAVEKLLQFVPKERIDDVVYFAPFDTDHPIGFNVMEDVGYDKRHLVVSGLMGTFKRIWADSWSARMEYILSNTLLALLEYPDSTLLDVNRMLINKAFRKDVVSHITDPIVKAFWEEEFANYTDTYTREATPAIQNKIGQFTSNPLIRNIVGQPRSTFDIRKIMDEKKILLVNLSKGRMGETNASLLGSMLVVKIYLAAMSRADAAASVMRTLPRFFFYVDEFQSVVNDAFADILSEARKYKLALIIAHQYVEQMEENVRNAVFGNVGTTVTFRVGPFDAEVLKTIFEPTFYPEDLVNLGIGQIYLTLMIDGVGSPPFSAQTIGPTDEPEISYDKQIILRSREQFAQPRAVVQQLVDEKMEKFLDTPAARSADALEKQRAKETRQNGGNGNGGYGNGRPPRERNGNTDDHSRPKRPAPEPKRSPADILRQHSGGGSKSDFEKKPSGQNGRDDKEAAQRSALRDAIARAGGGNNQEQKPKPQPQSRQQNPESRQAEPARDSEISKRKDEVSVRQHGAAPRQEEISPEELRRLINGGSR